MPRWTVTVFCLLCAMTLWACGDKQPPAATDNGAKRQPPIVEGLTREQAAKVVAKVGDKEITVGDVTEQINRLSPYIKRRWATPEKRKEFLQKLIQIELLSQEAIRNGLDTSPEVQRAAKQVMVRLMVKNDLQNELFPTSIDDNTLQEAYEKDWAKYHSPAQHRISQIVVATEAEATQLIADIQSAPNPRARFRELARTVSIDEKSKAQAGDIGYVLNPAEVEASKKNGAHRAFKQAEGVSDLIAVAAWQLKDQNELFKAPVKDKDGFHVLMLTTVKPALNRSFNSVKRLIESRLLREVKKEKMNEFVTELRKKANVKIYKENLDKVKVNHSSTTSTAIADTDSASTTNVPPQPDTTETTTPQGTTRTQKTSDQNK